MGTNKSIYVYLNLSNKDYFVGTLLPNRVDSFQNSSFEYSDEWLNNPLAFPLSKDLPLKKNVFKSEYKLFSMCFYSQAFFRCSEYYFVYLLIFLKKHNLLSSCEDFDEVDLYNWFKDSNVLSGEFGRYKENMKILSIINAMLYNNDITRKGAFRFKLDKSKDFYLYCDNYKMPTVDKIDEIIDLKSKVDKNIATIDDVDRFHSYVSSLGGRKVKTSILDKNGNLCIAKFSYLIDDNYLPFYRETFALYLAKKFGIKVQEYSTPVNKDGKPFLLLKRFDRRGTERFPFLSLENFYGDYIDETQDKLVSELIIQLCKKKATKNLREFFKRKLFRTSISNHLELIPNSGFLYTLNDGWNLSPDFDMSVEIFNNEDFSSDYSLKDEINAIISDYNHLIKNAYYYRVTRKKARKMVNKLKKLLANYKEDARKFGFNDEEISKMGIFLDAFDKIKINSQKRKSKRNKKTKR